MIVWVISFLWLFCNVGNSYYFWLKSADNTPENIVNIEKTLNVHLPIVSFIFDPREESDVLNSVDKIVDQLWTDRIYHFTVSPDKYSAEDVVMWKFDNQYRAFFKKVKEKNLHVIFRTMHEMNGWRYARSSNPDKFKAAWIHVWTLSRLEWLDQENIVFDFSVNHRDMPTNEEPSQSASLIECRVWKTNCWHFEDYYPWDEFVDVVGFTFYNWGKSNSNRQWLSPEEILYDKNRNTYERVYSFNKPVIIDEVATTAVRYTWNYNYSKSREEYLSNDENKDYWLSQLQDFLNYRPEILAAIYFNTDYTHWLMFQVVWEADWAVVNLDDNKVYNWFRWIELFGEKDLTNILKTLFGVEQVNINGNSMYISPSYAKEVKVIWWLLDKKFDSDTDKLEFVQKLQSMNFKSISIKKALVALENIYNV